MQLKTWSNRMLCSSTICYQMFWLHLLFQWLVDHWRTKSAYRSGKNHKRGWFLNKVDVPSLFTAFFFFCVCIHSLCCVQNTNRHKCLFFFLIIGESRHQLILFTQKMFKNKKQQMYNLCIGRSTRNCDDYISGCWFCCVIMWHRCLFNCAVFDEWMCWWTVCWWLA